MPYLKNNAITNRHPAVPIRPALKGEIIRMANASANTNRNTKSHRLTMEQTNRRNFRSARLEPPQLQPRTETLTKWHADSRTC